MNSGLTTYKQHLQGTTDPDLLALIGDILSACKLISREVNKAGLVGLLGEAGSVNVQGEDVQKLDIFSNDTMIDFVRKGGQCCVLGSEELDDILTFPEIDNDKAGFAVLTDPLDGSSNIDVNASIGTIFSIYRRVSQNGPGTVEDCLQAGSEQVAAGYVIYGSSTLLVLTVGQGVNAYTLDQSIGEFCLSHEQITTPADGKIYSINEGNWPYLGEGVRRYIDWAKEEDKETKRPYSARYIGSLVADFHRNMLKGGIFMYPGTSKAPNGKLRLVYECNPMAFICEQAGGRARDGRGRILEKKPKELHERCPLFIGSENMIDKVQTSIMAWG